MSLNCNELNLIIDELDLSGAFVQDIVQPGYDSIALYTYRTGKPKIVFICLAAGSCRMNETKRKIPRNDKPLRFMEFLRSRIKGALIVSCRQIGKERVVELRLRREGKIFVLPAASEQINKTSSISSPSSEQEELILYIRLWSNAGNVLLCDQNDLILDSFYRRPAKNEMTGCLFTPPAPRTGVEEKEWPVRTFDEIQAAAAAAHPDAPPLSFNEKVDAWYSEHAAAFSREALLSQAEKWYEGHKSRQESALERLRAKRSAFMNAAQWKHQGDLILSFGSMIDGSASFLECEDYETGKPVRIKIDPRKNAQENAAVYYETYKKETSGREDLDHDIALAEKSIAELEAAYQAMKNEKNPVKLEQMLRKDSKPRQQEKKAHPGLRYDINGWTLYVGRDANENDDLLRHWVKGADLWLHTRDYAGGYVFIKNRPGKTVPLDILLYAGNLAVYYSKARKNGTADLYYTQVKFLRRAKNGPKGLVLPTHEKNLHIALDDEKMHRLDEIRQEQDSRIL